MPLGTPIQLDLYDENDEVKGTFSRARVPVTFAERAIEMSGSLKDGMGIEQLQSLYVLVVDFFGNQFTVEDLRNGADLGELVTVIKAIATRAVELMPTKENPTKPGS
jgi:hypothetical protein